MLISSALIKHTGEENHISSQLGVDFLSVKLEKVEEIGTHVP
jgi:hypothetical protein